jgi:hypothetical protein
MSTDDKKKIKKKESSKDNKEKDLKKPKKPKKSALENTPFNVELSFIDKFYQARTTEQSWKNEGQNYVWIEDKREVCVIGEVTGRNNQTQEFTVLTQDGVTHSIHLDSIYPMNPPDYGLNINF